MRTRFTLLLGLVWLLSIGAAAGPVRMTPVKIADNVYLLQNSRGSGNSTVVFTDDGALVFDFAIDSADQTLAFIRKTTDKKIMRYYSRFKEWRGLALWCDMTRDWMEEK